MPPGYGLILMGEIACNCLEESESENKLLEGLSPERILLDNDWFEGITEVKIDNKKKKYNSFAYYPPEYLEGQPWTPSCTCFAIFAISYKILTKELPYLGNIPQGLLSTNEGKELILKSRKDNGLNLSKIPTAFREFFTKGLALKPDERFNAIGDTADLFSNLCSVVNFNELNHPKNVSTSSYKPTQTSTAMTLDFIIRQYSKNIDYAKAFLIFYNLIYEVMKAKKNNINLIGLNPENILLTDDWEVSGKPIAGIITSKSSVTKNYNHLLFFAPDFFENRVYDESCITFALTSILYILVAGKYPYVTIPTEELLLMTPEVNDLMKIRANPLDLTSTKIPQCLVELFEIGLGRRKKSRFQSVDELYEYVSEHEYSSLLDDDESSNTDGVTLEYQINVNDMLDDSEMNMNNIEGDGHIVSDGLYIDDDENLEDETNYLRRRLQEESKGTRFELEIIKGKGKGFKDVAGMEEVKTYLSTRVISVLKRRKDAKKYRLSIPSGLLLYGPQGCGKTFIARKFAEEARMNCAIVKASDLACTFVHGTQSMIGQLFDRAREAAKRTPLVLIIDEFDALVPDRSDTLVCKHPEEINEWLMGLDKASENNIFVIAMTNRPDIIDPAILRTGRFDKRLYIDMPDEALRSELFFKGLEYRPITEDVDTDRLAELTASGYVCSDIECICDEAATEAFSKNTSISQEMLESAIARTSPSVNKHVLRQQEEIRHRMDNSASFKHRQVGFC